MNSESTSDAACSGWDNGECTGSPHCPPRCPRFFDSSGEPILITPLEEDEFGRLVSMYDDIDRTNRSSGLPPKTREEIVTWLDSLTKSGWNLLARSGDHVVGHVGAMPGTAEEVEFVIFVADAYQGRGIGTELLKQLVAHADARGYDVLHLSVERNNEQAISIYENLSFEITTQDLMTTAMRLSLEKPIADKVQRPPAER